MERIKNYLINFMRGRYGIDQMSQTLFIAALIFILFAGFTQNFLFEMIGIALFAYADYRALSKNIPARRAENAALSGNGKKYQRKNPSDRRR